LGLVERPATVLTGIGGVDQKVDLAGAGGGFDAFGAVDQRAATGLQPQPVERRLAQRSLNLLAEISGNLEVGGLECPS